MFPTASQNFGSNLTNLLWILLTSSGLANPNYIHDPEISPNSINCKDSIQSMIMSETNGLKLIANNHNIGNSHEWSLLSGQAVFLGEYDKCINMKETKSGKMKYCIFDLEINIFTEISVRKIGDFKLQIGLCTLPACLTENFATVISYVNKNSHIDDAQRKYHIQISKKDQGAFCPLTNVDYDMTTIFTCAFIIILVGLVVLATALDMKTPRDCAEYSSDLILAFSLPKNLHVLFATKNSESSIKVVIGIRVICMFWIILYHVHFTALLYPEVSNNPDYFKKLSRRFLYQPITNVTFAVDSFLFLSSLLSAYWTLKDMERYGRFRWWYFYLHRYFHISPLHYFFALFSFTIFPHLGSGPFWRAFDYHSCQKTWWTNLIYAMNFLSSDQCYGVTWYLAVDMQLYIISPIFIVLLFNAWYVGLVVITLMMVGASITVGIIANSNGYYAAVSANPNHTYQIVHFYNKPYFRINAYLVGIVFAYILYKKDNIFSKYDSPLKKRITNLASWMLAGLLCISVTFGTYREWHGQPFSNLENVTFLMFSGIAWCTGLAIIIYCCNNTYGGVVNVALSWSGWDVLAKLTFGAYLSHMLVFYHTFGTFRSDLTYTNYFVAQLYIISVIKSYSVSLLTAVMIELPLAKVTSLCFTRLGIQTRPK